MTQTRAGFAAIIGAPNAGKSTLVNALVGEKVSIVTHKVQTTRFQVRGIAMLKDTDDLSSQVVLVDTPGIFKAGSDDRLGLNKIDEIAHDRLLELIAHFKENDVYQEIFLISALNHDGVETLSKHLAAAMPKGPYLYPEDQAADLPSRQRRLDR